MPKKEKQKQPQQIYLVKIDGNTQTNHFYNYEKAKEFAEYFSKQSYEIYEYSTPKLVKIKKPTPLYKIF